MPDEPGPSLTNPAIDPVPFSLRRFLIFLIFAPIVWLAILVYIYGVDTPYWDEWDEMPSDLIKIHDGTFGWSDLVVQHNEHRIIFPHMIMLAVAWVTSWNIRAAMFVTWLLACIGAFNLWRLSRATGSTHSDLDLGLLALSSILFFTPVAFENWLWGFQIGFLLPVALVTMAVVLVSTSRPFPAFFIAILLSFICTFSIASGFLCWFITLPLLLFSQGRWQWRDRRLGIICWFVGMCGSMAIYFHGFVRQPDDPSPFLALEQPVMAMCYLFVYFGSPFSWSFTLTISGVIGASLLILFAGALAYLWRFRTDSGLLAQTLPWLMLAIYSVMNGILTMMGRLNYGPNQASGPRYMAFSILLPIALLFIVSKIYRHWRPRAQTATQVQAFHWVLFTYLCLIMATNILSAMGILSHWASWKKDRRISEMLVEFSGVTKEDSLMNKTHFTYGDPARLREYAPRLGELGYLRPAPVKSAAIADLADVHAEPSAEYGHFDNISLEQGKNVYAYGWAVLPDKERVADLIILTYEEKDHPENAQIFALGLTGVERLDVVDSTRNEEYERSGWVTLLKPGLVPPGLHVIKAWAFDLDANRAYRLDGSYQVEIPETPTGKK